MSYLPEQLIEVYKWIDAAPCACESYKDDKGNIQITVLIDVEESECNQG